MNHRSKRLLSALGVAGLLASFLPAVLRADAAAQSCNDCCKLPCIEAEIVKAKYQREAYRALAKRKDLTTEQYLDAEATLGAAGEAIRIAAAAGLPTCNYYIPEQQSYAESRQFIMAGFKLRRDEQGRVLPSDYTLRTDPQSCVANSKALELAPKVAACAEIGSAQVAHEEKHVADCEKLPAAARHRTPSQLAAAEVPGYNAEITALEQARRQAAEACNKTSCKVPQKEWDDAAQRMNTDILTLLGKGPKKPPTKSPLARKTGGN
jgi:hypothetical protein